MHTPDPTVQDVILDRTEEGLRLAETELPQTQATVALVGGDELLHARDAGAFQPANRTELKAAVEDYCSDSAAATSIYGPISEWDTSQVADMSFLFSKYNSSDEHGDDFPFYYADYPESNCGTTFNEDISGWIVNQVTTMEYMFWESGVFDQDLSQWNTAKVTSMSHMFEEASAFNQDIGQWDVSNVTNMA